MGSIDTGNRKIVNKANEAKILMPSNSLPAAVYTENATNEINVLANINMVICKEYRNA
eukprot:CAMPEP_0202726118 /NCGR_PEP_ID=MMETSP1385-20130828/184448_1 /ASSEMBLY_ACC=CAM_ASM_000861 /TAXON_ID=933848 /ORGANISM="Elphidium margaritaceum" /LENGTH=57 /DNA_ID=CAMNT_0049392331 /DNA_START=24 /DNA_END=197 /DNA_ORIENTATION=+